MTQINQYPQEALALGDEDLFDIDYYDSSGMTYETKRVKWGTIKTQLTSDKFADNISNANLTMDANSRTFNLDDGTFSWNNIENMNFNIGGAGSSGHSVTYLGAQSPGKRMVRESINLVGDIKQVFASGSRFYRALQNGTFWFGDDSTIGQFTGLEPNPAFHATFISEDKKTCFTDIAVPTLPTTDVQDSIAWFRSETKGVLFPNLTEAARNAIPTPRLGLVVYNTDTNKLQVYDGSVPTGWSNLN